MNKRRKLPNKELLEELLSLSVESAQKKLQGPLVTKFEEAVDAGLHPFDIWETAIRYSADQVGVLFKKNEIFIPEVLLWARELKKIREITRDKCGPPVIKYPDKPVVIAVVKGDLHDIGKNLVVMMTEAAGFKVRDLDINVAPWEVVQAIKDENARLVGLSALLTTTMPKMEETIKAIDKENLRPRVKVVIGGAPVTQDYADKIKANAYADTSFDAVEAFKKLAGIAEA